MTKETRLGLRIPEELLERIERQRKKENRSQSAFIRRVLDRYLVEQEFRGNHVSAEAAAGAEESIKENRKLLDLLRNS